MSLHYDLINIINAEFKNHKMISNYVMFACQLSAVYEFTMSFREKPPKPTPPEEAIVDNTSDSPPVKLVKEFPGVYKLIFLLINIIFFEIHFYIHKKYKTKKKQNKYIKGLYFVFLYIISPIIFMLSQLYFYTLFYPKEALFHPKLYKNINV